MKNHLLLLVTILLTASLPAQTTTPEKIIETKSGLKYIDLVEGTGAPVEKGKKVTCHYVGKLENGRTFDSSKERGKPFVFIHGVTGLIQGWIEGVSTMKEGGKRKLMIPYRLGYGSEGAGDSIPPNSNLIFELEVLKVE